MPWLKYFRWQEVQFKSIFDIEIWLLVMLKKSVETFLTDESVFHKKHVLSMYNYLQFPSSYWRFAHCMVALAKWCSISPFCENYWYVIVSGHWKLKWHIQRIATSASGDGDDLDKSINCLWDRFQWLLYFQSMDSNPFWNVKRLVLKGGKLFINAYTCTCIIQCSKLRNHQFCCLLYSYTAEI